MDILSNFIGKAQSQNAQNPQEPCPNCWGKQTYNKEFVDYQKDLTLSNINHNKRQRKSFILQFMETNIDGIRLKQEGLNQVCPTGQSHFKSFGKC